MGQMAKEIGELKAQGIEGLPSQTIDNTRENVNAITLKSGKTLENEDNKAKPLPTLKTMSTPSLIAPKDSFQEPSESYIPHLFPSHLANPIKKDSKKEVLDTFRKVHINIPLLDAIKQVPRYVKFLKDLCSTKRKLKGNKIMNVGENCTTTLQRKLPPKLKHPGCFKIPYTIGKNKINNAMLDLGASINVMPYFVSFTLNIGTLKETDIVIQLADKSNAYPRGVLEDVRV